MIVLVCFLAILAFFLFLRRSANKEEDRIRKEMEDSDRIRRDSGGKKPDSPLDAGSGFSKPKAKPVPPVVGYGTAGRNLEDLDLDGAALLSSKIKRPKPPTGGSFDASTTKNRDLPYVPILTFALDSGVRVCPNCGAERQKGTSLSAVCCVCGYR